MRSLRSLPLAALVLALAPRPTPTPAPRRVAVRYQGIEASLAASGFKSDSRWARSANVEPEVAPEGTPVPKGAEVVHVCALPACIAANSVAGRFPVTLEEHSFVFDGRTYSGEEDTILLADPATPGEVFVVGVSAEPAVKLAQQRIFFRDALAGDYAAVSGDVRLGLRKTGRFTQSAGALAVDRASDKDEIAERDAFYRSLVREKKGVVTWECAPSEKPSCEKWQQAAAKLSGKKPFTVRVFPDALSKARWAGSSMPQGSSRPADIVVSEGAVRIELDASAPAAPEFATAALASAAATAARPALANRPILLWAIGARRAGTWWGRDVKSFGAFARAANVEPSIEDVLGAGDNVSPVLAVGAVASWLDAGARLDGQAAVEKALGGADAALVTALAKWREVAWRQGVLPPVRRPLPDGFLAGVSYAMRNSLDGGYLSQSSAKALERLHGLGATSVSIMPFAFSPERSTAVEFVHRDPRGETDESILRAVGDARALGMTAMIKPQVWVGGQFVGRISMADEASWRTWFESYRRFVVHHAVVAEAAGAAIFCVGTELTSTEAREKDWRAVFSAVRLATGAPLVYAANWAARVPDITFWDALDAIGADFYDPLGKGNEKLSDARLEEGVRRAARPLAETSRKYSNRPVILTEAGYPPVRAAWLTPHDGDSTRPLAPEDAVRCVAAVYRALSRETWWKGVYWWKAFSDGAPPAAGERGFNFVGTPVEKAISEGWKALGR